MDPVTWINCFELPEGQEDIFFADWLNNFAAHFRTKPGFVGFRMYRAHSWQGRFAFINVTQWESVAHVKAAHDDTFRELVKNKAVAETRAFGGVFEVVAES